MLYVSILAVLNLLIIARSPRISPSNLYNACSLFRDYIAIGRYINYRVASPCMGLF